MTEPTTPTGKFVVGLVRPIESDEVAAIEAEARAQERERLRDKGEARRDDLRDCGKDDWCHVKAEGATLVLDDMGLLAEPSEDRT